MSAKDFEMQKSKRFFALLVLIIYAGNTFAQTKKFNIQTTFPPSLTVCGKTDSLVYEIRNISSSGINNVFLTLRLPTGCYYRPSSFKGKDVTESNISNLNTPVFKFNNFTLAGYVRFSVKVNSTCDLQTFISKGNQAYTQLYFTYTGGNESHVSGNLNVNIPNILLNTITNQVKNAYLNDNFVRETSIKNTGKGGAAGFTFYRTNGNGLKVISSRSKDKYNGDSIISKLDSNDFKQIGNKDIFLDAGEEIKITDTVKVVKCYNLIAIYNVKFGCGNTVCNTSSKNAIVNLDPFTAGLTIIPKTTIDWCFDSNKPASNEIIVINKSNKPISNTIVNVFQSYNGGFYSYQMSAIDTSSLIVTKGKYGPKLNKKFTSIWQNSSTTYFTCLGSNPIGGFALGFGSLKVGDTIYVRWKSISCIPNVCNTTITAHRWRYSATYNDTCGAYYSVTENWGSGGGIQYLGAIPWIPTDLVSGTPDILNYNISSISLFPLTNKSKFSIKLVLESGIKHSLKPDDFKFTDVNGTDWKPYKVFLDSNEIWAFFNRPTINLAKSELNIVIETDCKASNPKGLKNYAIAILYKPDSTCNNTDFQLYCTSGKIKIHCTKTCSNGGMLFRSFKVKRKNYGKPDNNNDGSADATGSIDFAKVKTNRSFVYDTLSTFYSGIVTPSGTTTIFFNGRVKSSVTNGNLLKPLQGIISIYRNGKLRYTCNKLPVSTYLSGTKRFCEIDLNLNAATSAGCGTISNYFFLQGDSVVVTLNYVYTTNIGPYSGEAVFDNPEFYLSTTPNPNASQKLQCDTFSGRHILLGAYFTNWYTENYSSSSCSPVSLNNSFYFSAGSCCSNYAGGNPFPFEYRNFNYLEKIKVTLPKGYSFSSASIYYYASKGTSNYTTYYSTNLKPVIKNGDTLIFNLDTLFNPSKGIFKRSDEGYQGTLVLNLVPGCKAAINTYETVKYSSYFKWTDAGVTDVIENNLDSLKFNHPSVLLSAINSISVSKKDTFSWDIILSNTKSGSSIGNVWLANTLPQKVKIIAIKDLSTGTNLQVKNGIFKAGNLSSTTTRSFRIYATSTACKSDSFRMAIGWNCDNYPDSLDAYSCKNLLNYLNLVLSPQPPLIISTLLEDTARTDVCTNRKYQALIANVDEDNIYQLKLRVTIPPGTSFVDTGMYYSFPYGSKFTKLSKPLLVTGTTFEWALSDSISALKNGLEKVSDSAKSKILIQFYLETNCQITAGAFVSIMPDGKIGCGEPVRRIGYTGRPIKIKGVDNPYYSLIKLSPDSINLCRPSVAFKAKIIYLGPTNTLANDSLILTMPVGFDPDTASLSTVRINGRGLVIDVNGEKRWAWAIPKGLLPGDSSMLDFKLKITNKAPACGSESFTMQAVTKKKAYCVKTKDSCDINVATGGFYKALKLDKAEPIIKLTRSVSINAIDSGEIVDIVFNVTNNKKAIDSSISTIFYLIVDKNTNGKFDLTDLLIKKYTKTQGWLNKQVVNFSFNGFVKNTDVCKMLIVSDTNNCQCLKNSLPILNLKLNNAGRDSSFCSNYSLQIGLDSIKKYKYEWLPSDYLNDGFKSKAIYKKPNFSAGDQNLTYILKTSRPSGCYSYDTVIIKSKPFIYLPKLIDTTAICEGEMAQIGDTAKGGKGSLNFNWWPTTNLSSSTKMVVNANPKNSIKYYLTVKDQNNCSIKDSVYLKVAKRPAVKIGHSGFCEKKDIKFSDQSNYFGAQKGTALWRIDFNNVTQTEPTWVFDTIGLYFVRLVVSNQYGCTDSNYKYIKVFGNPIPSNTKFSECLGDSVIFKDNSTVARMGIKNVTWKFATDSLIGKAVSKSISTPGKSYFTQVVISDSGCITQLFDSIYIFDKPKADFFKIGKCLNDTVDFIDISKFNLLDSISNYEWSINDTLLSSKQVSVLFDSTGIYSVHLKITTSRGCFDTISKTIAINPVPKASFNISNYCTYDTIKITNNSSIAYGNILDHVWQIDPFFNSNIANTIVTPLKEGTYTILLKVYSDSMCVDSLQKSFIVYPDLIPKSSLIQGCENDNMTFSDITIQDSTRIINRLWKVGVTNFPDSTFVKSLNSKGIYNYSFEITTLEGCKYSMDSTYEVFEKPKADFISYSPCMDDFVQFTDKSIAGVNATLTSTQWFEANIPVSSNPNFSTRFLTPGSKAIKLIVQNSFGCIDSITIPTMVLQANYADFNVKDACPEDTILVDFKGTTGNNSITNYNLEWGDGISSTILPSTHAYNSTGSYTVKLTVTTLPGCTYDTVKSITIFPVPKAKFDYYPQYPDVKNPAVTITDKSSGGTSWSYQFGDGNQTNNQNPIHSFLDSGEYFITQLVENQYGCKDTAVRRVYVNFILFTHIPSAFSPGMDDINPLFMPSGLGIKDYRITVFNRWGEKLFDEGWGKKPWNGTYKNEIVPLGIYPYYIEIIDFGDRKHNYNGVINVIR